MFHNLISNHITKYCPKFNMTIKIKSEELRKKSNQELLKMKEIIRFNILSPKNKGKRGFNLKEARKNVARINTVINERK